MTSVVLERLSISMEEGTVVALLVEEGALVAEGDALVEVETDKATAVVEAPAAGRVEFAVAVGAIVPVESELARIVDPAAAPGGAAAPAAPADGGAATAASGDGASAPAGSNGAASAAALADVPAPPSGGPRRLHGASPAAKRRAQAHGIELSSIAGTGPRGRIVIRDVVAALAAREAAAAQPAAAPAAGPAYPVEAPAPTAAAAAPAASTAAPAAPPAPAGGRDLRAAVVASVTASWREIPHINIGGQLDGAGLAAAKRAARGRGGGGPKVTATDLLVVALTKALRDVPELNATLGADGRPRRSDAIHVALAVATEHSGVVAPVLRDAGDRSLEGVARERARLVAAARAGETGSRDLAGATVTLSNLGLLPVDFFTPVISGPQVALIAIGRLAEVPVVADGMLGVGQRMWVNAAIDHRGADGEAGGRFLAAFERRLAELPAHV